MRSNLPQGSSVDEFPEATFSASGKQNALLTGVDGHTVGLVLTLILASALRFYHLDRTSIWYDEAASWAQARLPFLEMIRATAQDNYPPLHNIVLHVTIALFGDLEMALRAPSALFGVATIYLVYKLGAVLWDRGTGLIAAFLLTLSGFHVWQSSEARMYTLLAFAATLFVVTAVHAAQHPNWKTLVACAATAAALLYSHPYGGFVFAGVNLVIVFAAVNRARWVAVGWRSWISSQAVAVVLFLPWAFVLASRAGRAIQGDVYYWTIYQAQPTFGFVHQQLEELTSGALALISILAALSFINILAFHTPTPLVSALSSRSSQPWLRREWQNWILLSWLAFPILAGLIISMGVKPIFLSRYIICSLPALLLLAARGLRSLGFNRLIFGFCFGVFGLRFAAAAHLGDI